MSIDNLNFQDFCEFDESVDIDCVDSFVSYLALRLNKTGISFAMSLCSFFFFFLFLFPRCPPPLVPSSLFSINNEFFHIFEHRTLCFVRNGFLFVSIFPNSISSAERADQVLERKHPECGRSLSFFK